MLPLFPDAKEFLPRPQEPIIRTAVIDGDFRYELRRAWGSGPCVGWVMLNPSTADGKHDDPTIKTIMNRSCRLGFGKLVVVNIYPYRSPDPSILATWINRSRKEYWVEDLNLYDNAERSTAALEGCEMIIAAWGNHARRAHVHYWVEAVDMNLNQDAWLVRSGIPDMALKLHCLGLTKDGAPKHPLARGRSRIADDFKPILWDYDFGDENGYG